MIKEIKRLVYLSDHLDKKGLHKEADVIDQILVKLSSSLIPSLTPDSVPVGLPFGGQPIPSRPWIVSDSTLAKKAPQLLKYLKATSPHSMNKTGFRLCQLVENLKIDNTYVPNVESEIPYVNPNFILKPGTNWDMELQEVVNAGISSGQIPSDFHLPG